MTIICTRFGRKDVVELFVCLFVLLANECFYSAGPRQNVKKSLPLSDKQVIACKIIESLFECSRRYNCLFVLYFLTLVPFHKAGVVVVYVETT